MIIGTGTDIIEISRIKNVFKNETFLRKMFTNNEIEYLKCRGAESTAGYFCAKEAVAKCLGTGFSGFNFTDIEILKKNSAPYVLLHGNAQKIAGNQKIAHIFISISHCKEYATAIAIAEGNLDSTLQENISNNGIITNDNCREYPLNLLKKREPQSHKGEYGKLYIIGGSYNMSGSMILAARAAFRCGAGLVTCVIPESILNRLGSQVIEATYMVCKKNKKQIELSLTEMDEILSKCDVIALGIGLGRTNKIIENIEYLIKNSSKPMVIDADGLNMLSKIKNCLKDTKAKIVLTPHAVEMSRLTGLDVEYINKNRLIVAKSFAQEYKCVVLLKGAETIVTDGDRVYINITGNPGMASGGSGDVLTGMIASLIGQGYDFYDAAVIGSFIHGKAGDNAFEKYGYGLIAGDIIDLVGNYLKG